MIDVIKPNIFPNNIVSGIATGYGSDNRYISFFETPYYNSNSILSSRSELEAITDSKFNSYFYQKQIHSDTVDVDDNNLELNSINSDAIISNIRGTMYNISIADCQAILMYDPINNSIAAIHSGWKGTSLNIVNKTVSKMIDYYGTNPSQLLVYLSPSANVNNYEVGEEFLDTFPDTTIKVEDKYYFDNRKEIINQLLKTGIQLVNIESNNDCTITNNRYHSFRRDKNKSGRMSAFIGIKEAQ